LKGEGGNYIFVYKVVYMILEPEQLWWIMVERYIVVLASFVSLGKYIILYNNWLEYEKRVV
jgi:hypothetical protein